MLAQPVARSLDLDHHGMVQEPVEERRCDDGVAEDLAPFRKTAVGGQDHSAPLVAGIDELEEQIAAAGGDRQVADFVDDQQRAAAQEADFLAQGALAFGFGEDGEEIGERDEVDALASANGLDGECGGEVRFAGAGRPEQMNDLG
jgi:hypothetical protein